MFLTRIGFGSKAVVTGDPSQVDLQRGQRSGLMDACHVLKEVRGIAYTQFTSADIVRHPLVGRIVDAYEAASEHSAAHQAALGMFKTGSSASTSTLSTSYHGRKKSS
jgi:phosphate starvation-inducible PhoH-like protein